MVMDGNGVVMDGNGVVMDGNGVVMVLTLRGSPLERRYFEFKAKRWRLT